MKKFLLTLTICVMVLTGCSLWGGVNEEEYKEVAKVWIEENASTYTFDGEDLKYQSIIPAKKSADVIYTFTSRHGGYGDRTGQLITQSLTPHTITVTIEEGKVTAAVTDERYDELAKEKVE